MMASNAEPDDRLGAVPAPGGGYRFRVWAPRAKRVAVVYPGPPRRRFPLDRKDRGYFLGVDPRAARGMPYWLAVDRTLLPDPASRSQPRGNEGPSALVDLSAFGDPPIAAASVDLAHAVLYELHLGTFSKEGTFEGAIAHLDDLADLGVTAVELLPIEEERGERGWGYGPVHQFAVRRAYGGPEGLLRFARAAHGLGLGVLLDVVYNHWSVQASFLERFGPYFHPRATTPWGPTPNVDGPGSDEVRRYLFDNARMWLEEYGLDGFRLDAVHEVYDRSPRPFWGEFSVACKSAGARTGRQPVLIAESDLNDTKILKPVTEGGWGLDGQWSDDFHHALHAALTGERGGYYADYGPLALLARAFERPFLFEGAYSGHRARRHGASSEGFGADRFVVYDQNHDQVGNRSDGARLTTLVSPGLARVALGLTLFSPYVPMLFMGEEYGEKRPFYFFSDPPPRFTRRLVTGRLRQLQANGFADPPPDPTDLRTFEQSRLDWGADRTTEGVACRRLVAELLRLRRELAALGEPGTVSAHAWEEERCLRVRRDAGAFTAVLLANFAERTRRFEDLGPGPWAERLSSDRPRLDRSRGEDRDDGPGVEPMGGEAPVWVSPESFVVLERGRHG